MPKSATEAELGALFAAFGEVERVTVLESRGMHAGCAFVQFARWAACEAAIAALHEQHLMAGAEHPLVVKFADAKRSDAGAPLGGKRAGGGEGRGGLPAGMRSQPEMMLMHPGAHAGYYLGPEAAHHLSMQHAAAMGHRHPQHAQHAHHMGLAMGPPPQRGGLGGLPGGRLRRGGAGSGTGGSSDSLADHASGSDACEPAARRTLCEGGLQPCLMYVAACALLASPGTRRPALTPSPSPSPPPRQPTTSSPWRPLAAP
jgi:CUG-BP- and ETR3-like factor